MGVYAMEWVELTVRTASQGIELLCAELTEAGFDSFAVDDCGQFQSFLDEAQDYWDYVDESLTEKMQGVSQVRLYLPQENAEAELLRLRALLQALPERYPACDLGPLTIALEHIPGQDWENAWKQNYRPVPVGEKLLVVPRWMCVDDTQGRLPVILDLGLTFGTGEHESTQMCMHALERLVTGGERVADLGSGSGILSISALRLGAQSALAVDVDPAAEHIARENARSNGFDESRFAACTGNVLQDNALIERLSREGYDIVCANIVAGVLVRLLPIVPRLLRPGGVFLCSGILNIREAEVRQAIESAGLRVLFDEHRGQWCALTAKT